MNLLEGNFRSRVYGFAEQFQIEDGGTQWVDGPLLLKVITNLVAPETGSTDFDLHTQLQKVKFYGYDLIRLNEAVDALVPPGCHSGFGWPDSQYPVQGRKI